jgi:hypothetical protein
MTTNATTPVVIRTAAILTGALVASDSFEAGTADYMRLIVDFTIGSLTTLGLRIEHSLDNGTTWAVIPNLVVGTTNADCYAAEHKFNATDIYELVVPVSLGKYRVRAIGNGTATSSSLTLTYSLFSKS